MRNEEARLQAALWEYWQRCRSPNSILFHPANGGFRNVVEAVKFKRLGVVPGVSDFIAVKDGNPYALELKSAKGSLSEAQATWLIEWGSAGGRGAVAHSFDEGVEYLQEWKLVR